MGRSLPHLLAVVGLAGAFGLASCGGEDAKLLPGGTAREITANLSTVERLADEGDCVGAELAAQQVSEQIEALSGVDNRLKQALEEGADRLNDVVDRCEEEESEPIERVPTEAEEPEREPSDEKGEKELEKEERKEEKETEKDEREEEKETVPTPPAESPGLEREDDGGEGESPSGGVSPGAVEGDE